MPMTATYREGPRPRPTRLRALALVMLLATAVTSVVTARPALAAGCATSAHVYVDGGHFKFETDAINGPIDTLNKPLGTNITFGGNGLKPNEQPFWDIYREDSFGNLQYVTTRLGNKAGSNCVSNEKSFFVGSNIFSTPTPVIGTYVLLVTYQSGNSGAVIRQQRH